MGESFGFWFGSGIGDMLSLEDGPVLTLGDSTGIGVRDLILGGEDLRWPSFGNAGVEEYDLCLGDRDLVGDLVGDLFGDGESILDCTRELSEDLFLDLVGVRDLFLGDLLREGDLFADFSGGVEECLCGVTDLCSGEVLL